MATSPVEICNIALSRIGQKPITSLDDATVTSEICKKNYDPARKAMLTEFAWSFARKRASLPALASSDPDAPAWGFAFGYSLPADYLWIEEVDVNEQKTPWQVEGNTIVTDAGAPLKILYTRDEEDTTKFTSQFEDALADQLAGEIVFGITKDVRYRDTFFKSAAFKASKGRSTDSQQGSATVPDANALIVVRR